MIHRYTTLIKAINLTLDYIILNLSMILAWYFVERSFFLPTTNHYLPIFLLFNFNWLLATNITGLYKHVLNKDSIITFRGLVRSYLLFISFVSFTILLFISAKTYLITPRYLLISLVLFGSLLTIW